MASNSKEQQIKCDGKEGKITGGAIALLLGLFLAGCIAIIAAAAIALAHERTNELLECRQRLANSPEASEVDKTRATELQESIWVTTPKWAVMVTIALVGMLSFASLANTLPVMFWRVRRKILCLAKSTSNSQGDMMES